jgi:Protein of unknown function (DUF2878)
MKTLINVVFFQALWLVSVGGAGQGYWWVGLPVLALFIVYHFLTTPWKKADAQLMLISIFLGFIADSVLVQLGLLQFMQAIPWLGFAPVWIVVLWAGFALTLNHSMAFFQTRIVWAVVFGFFGGPLAYYVAANVWKAVSFTAPPYHVYGALAVVWAIMTPLLLFIGVKLKLRSAS